MGVLAGTKAVSVILVYLAPALVAYWSMALDDAAALRAHAVEVGAFLVIVHAFNQALRASALPGVPERFWKAAL